MTRDELQALLRVCPACNGTGWPKGWCHTCAGMGYVLPATPDVLELAGAGAALPPDPVAAVCSIVSHDCAVTIPQALMLLSKEYGLTTEQATTLLVRAASKFRAWQADTEAALEQERRAVGKLASQAVALGCPPGMSAKCPHGDKMVAYMDGKCARCWAAWARERAREEAAKQNGADNGDS